MSHGSIRWRQRLASALAAPLLASLGACQAADVPGLETPRWARPGALQLRRESVGDGLLLRHESGAVYRFRPPASLAEADGAAWDAGAPEVADCQRQLPPLRFTLDPASGRASLGPTPVALAGAVAVGGVASPGGRWVAALSASGRRASLMPALGQGHQPPFHLQVLDAAGGAHGPSRRLPFSGRTSAVQLCWSPDERWVAAVDLVCSQLALVPVEP